MSSIVKRLDWDSALFGFPVGQVILKGTTFSSQTLLRELKRSCSRVVYVVVQECSPEARSRLESIGAEMYTTKLTFTKRISPSSEPDCIECYRGEMTPELEQLAYSSGVCSRYRLDRRFSTWFEPLYRLWLAKSLDGSIADEVFVARRGNKLTGLATVQTSTARALIGLVSVSTESRGQGIGSALLAACETAAFEKKNDLLEVVTQRENEPACALYLKNGFQVTNEHTVFHCWQCPEEQGESDDH